MSIALCHFCETEVDAEDSLCYGCQKHICDDCDEQDPWGDHTPEAHSYH